MRDSAKAGLFRGSDHLVLQGVVQAHLGPAKSWLGCCDGGGMSMCGERGFAGSSLLLGRALCRACLVNRGRLLVAKPQQSFFAF